MGASSRSIRILNMSSRTIASIRHHSIPDAAFFNLVRGGVRFVTGAIGMVKRKNWRMRTAVATIGSQGTGAYERYGDNSLKDLFVDASDGTLEATAVRSAMDVSGSSITSLMRR